MISRVAESCFWLARYLERAETMARLISVHSAFVLDVDLPSTERWMPLVIVAGEEERFRALYDEAATSDGELVQRYLTWEQNSPVSILTSLASARENARTIRETISLEMWETINDLWLWLNGPAARALYARERHSFYHRIRNSCWLFYGAVANTMLHEKAYYFMRLGTLLERPGQTARILDVHHHSFGRTQPEFESAAEVAQWAALLRSCSGIEPFLKRGAGEISGQAVAGFLLLDRAFPRSVYFNLERATRVLDTLRPPHARSIGERAAAGLAEIVAELEHMRIDTVMERGVHEVLTWVVDSTARVCATVAEEFFHPPLEAAAVA